jgi:orotate phosphoribosyltransferase-like protein|tara:strand:- start:1529 stop:1708 length:180 start_codon:yes stop_codon:yes gene_type:complete
MTLSDKIKSHRLINDDKCISESDVKEFIKELKDKNCTCGCCCRYKLFIDKLAGDKLNGI